MSARSSAAALRASVLDLSQALSEDVTLQARRTSIIACVMFPISLTTSARLIDKVHSLVNEPVMGKPGARFVNRVLPEWISSGPVLFEFLLRGWYQCLARSCARAVAISRWRIGRCPCRCRTFDEPIDLVVCDRRVRGKTINGRLSYNRNTHSAHINAQQEQALIRMINEVESNRATAFAVSPRSPLDNKLNMLAVIQRQSKNQAPDNNKST